MTAHLDHLQRLGVDAIWLTPVYLSPQVDNGYDVADYCAIDPAMGTMEDFDELVAALAEHGYRLEGLRAFDAFPMTHHVECVATFRRADAV